MLATFRRRFLCLVQANLSFRLRWKSHFLRLQSVLRIKRWHLATRSDPDTRKQIQHKDREIYFSSSLLIFGLLDYHLDETKYVF